MTTEQQDNAGQEGQENTGAGNEGTGSNQSNDSSVGTAPDFTYDAATRTFHALAENGDILEYVLAADESFDEASGLIVPTNVTPLVAAQTHAALGTEGDQTKEEATQDEVKVDAAPTGGDAAVGDIPQSPNGEPEPKVDPEPDPDPKLVNLLDTNVNATTAAVDPAPLVNNGNPVDSGASGTVTANDQASSAPAAPASASQGAIQTLTKTVDGDTAAMLHNVLGYMDVMKPKVPSTQESQIRQQVTLYKSLTGIINRTEQDFNKVWSAILNVFHEHGDGVFHERYVFRHSEHMPLGATDRAAFHNILNMIKLTADPQSRQHVLKHLDFAKATQHGLNDAGRNKLASFYKL
jgi:outer membrane biosynthesis protein TonB